jgi:hypothetical protein
MAGEPGFGDTGRPVQVGVLTTIDPLLKRDAVERRILPAVSGIVPKTGRGEHEQQGKQRPRHWRTKDITSPDRQVGFRPLCASETPVGASSKIWRDARSK